MRTYYLEEMTWPEIEKALAEGYKTVVIFSGAVEQHGPHLPEATDAISASICITSAMLQPVTIAASGCFSLQRTAASSIAGIFPPWVDRLCSSCS